jgi:hypothetical protein
MTYYQLNDVPSGTILEALLRDAKGSPEDLWGGTFIHEHPNLDYMMTWASHCIHYAIMRNPAERHIWRTVTLGYFGVLRQFSFPAYLLDQQLLHIIERHNRQPSATIARRLTGVTIWDLMREEVLKDEDMPPADAIEKYGLARFTVDEFKKEWGEMEGKEKKGEWVEEDDFLDLRDVLSY